MPQGGVGAQVRRSFSPRCSGNNQSDQSKEIMRWKGWTPAGALAVWKRGAEGKEPTNEKYTREGKKKNLPYIDSLLLFYITPACINVYLTGRAVQGRPITARRPDGEQPIKTRV